MLHLGDITKISGYSVPITDVVIGGSPCQDLSIAGRRAGLAGERSGLFAEQIRIIKEMREVDRRNGRTGQLIRPRFMVWENVCFTGDTLITCKDGYKAIENVRIGDMVKTHTGDYKTVAKCYKTKKQPVIHVKVSGNVGVTATPNHPFIAIKKIHASKGERTFSKPEIVPAYQLTKQHMVGYKIDVPSLPDDFISESQAWAVGRWLADGCVDLNRSNPRIFISSGIAKADETRTKLSKLPYDIFESQPHKTANNFTFTSNEFYSLIASAECGAYNKNVPAYIFELPYNLQKAVLDGYISGDGYIRKRGNGVECGASTVSKNLAYGIARLIRNVYHVNASVSNYGRRNGKIRGRAIRSNYDAYSIVASLTSKVATTYFDGSVIWVPVKSVESVPERQTVYNLSVLEDNTYAANDIMVHNCGAFSSNGGDDFRTVLEETIRIAEPEVCVPGPAGGERWPTAGAVVGDGYSVAWRVLDAQYWGVPQRRRRIALVADFGGHAAPEILFVRESLHGNIEPGETARQEDSAGTKSGADQTVFCIQGNCIDRADTAGCNGKGWTTDVCYTLNTIDRPAVAYTLDNEKQTHPINTMVATRESPEARTTFGVGVDGHQPVALTFPDDVAHTLLAKGQLSHRADEDTLVLQLYKNHGTDSRLTGPLDAAPTVCTRFGTGGNNTPLVLCMATGQANAEILEDVCPTLNCNHEAPIVAADGCLTPWDVQSGRIYGKDGAFATLQSNAGKTGLNRQAVFADTCVRRLTPLECERLQGYPDGWTDIGAWTDSKGKRHKESSDSARYRALGNSIALPPWKWVLKRICACYERDATMASLFDGIGGFPLIWEQLNGEGSCLWCSEIEEFATAVTKYRFDGKEPK